MLRIKRTPVSCTASLSKSYLYNLFVNIQLGMVKKPQYVNNYKTNHNA